MKIHTTLQLATLVIASTLSVIGISHAQDNSTTTDADRFRRLEEAVQQLQQENRELRQQVQELKPASANFAPGTNATDKAAFATNAVELAASSKSPFVLPWGKEAKLKLGGFIQANAEGGDVASSEGRLADGPNAVNNRFRLRRARIGVTGEFLEHFDFKLEGDFEQGDGTTGGRTSFSGTDIFINWNRFPEANVKVGQFKAPFGLEMITPDTTLFTAERTLVTGAITPERQIGVQLWGKPLANLWPDKKDLLNYSVGMFNGNGRNTTVNDNNEFMYVGRVELTPWVGKLFQQDARLKLGLNGLYSRDAANVNLSQTGNLRLQPDGSLLPFNNHSADERTAWGADLSFNLGGFDLVAEYLQEQIRASGTTALVTPASGLGTLGQFTTQGYYVQGSYYFWKKKLQLIGRWESFNPGQAANDDIYSAPAGLNYYIKGNDLKLMLDYIHTWSDLRRNNPGLGQAEFNQVLARMQLMF
jgi:phosphate-selective porin